MRRIMAANAWLIRTNIQHILRLIWIVLKRMQGSQ
jgi:hypothetical protein